MSAWGSCAKNLPSTWPRLAYKVKLGQLGHLWEARGTPAAIPLCRPNPPQFDLRVELAKRLGEDTSMGQSRLRRRLTHSRERSRSRWPQSPPLYTLVGTSHPLLALHDPFLLTSGSATPWSTPLCSWDPMSPGAGCDDVMRWDSHWRETKEETSQVWCGWIVGWWAYVAHGPNSLLNGGCGAR